MDNETDRLKSFIAEAQESSYYSELLAKVETVCLSLGLCDEASPLLCNRNNISSSLDKLWLPVALNIATKRNRLDRTSIQGVLGSQGTGKTTLCLILQHILNYLGFSTATLSIDDLYLTYAERQILQQQDPRLIWRGPPGTHDVSLGLQILEYCLKGRTEISLPRFDKSAFDGAGDRTIPETVAKPDILLFEGWFVGVQPLAEYPNDFPLPVDSKEDIRFAKDNNERLQAYLPLWDKLDSLIVLSPEDYRLSKQWRREAEQKTIDRGKTGMSDEECDRFVEYFWKALHPELYIKPLSKTVDLVIEIKSDRTYQIISPRRLKN